MVNHKGHRDMTQSTQKEILGELCAFLVLFVVGQNPDQLLKPSITKAKIPNIVLNPLSLPS
jgi:hypothetical protein